jgi:hypothetical protein
MNNDTEAGLTERLSTEPAAFSIESNDCDCGDSMCGTCQPDSPDDYSVETRRIAAGRYVADIYFYYPTPGRYVRRHTTREAGNRHSAHCIGKAWIAGQCGGFYR